jgi:hypothetical protein
MERRTATALCLLRNQRLLLLELFLRISDLPGLHAGKPVGNVLQQHHMGMPGLRQDPFLLIGDPIMEIFKNPGGIPTA